MKKILVLNGIINEKQLDHFRSLPDVECTVTGSDASEELILSANAILGNFPAKLLAKSKNLEWLQLFSSGADMYAGSDISEDVVITTTTGAFGAGIAEYMVAMLINMMKKVPLYLENQKNGIWRSEGIVTSPAGKRVLIVGTGNLGSEFAKRIRAFGSYVVGIRRREGAMPEGFDEMHLMGELSEELKRADVVALCLPGTADTCHLMDENMLANCKEGAYLMNVGRGNVIPMEALLNKAVTDRFAGIWIDVCETEPLPNGHPLFSVENLLITPHITGGFYLDATVERIFNIWKHNADVWLHGGEYKNLLDRKSGYCK